MPSIRLWLLPRHRVRVFSRVLTSFYGYGSFKRVFQSTNLFTRHAYILRTLIWIPSFPKGLVANEIF